MPADPRRVAPLQVAGLSVSVPTGAVNLRNVAAGVRTVTGQLGNVSVRDGRLGLLSRWTATVTGTDFTTGGGTTYERVPRASVSYATGLANVSGIGIFTPSLAGSLGGTHTAGSFATVAPLLVASTTTWNPTITVSLGATQAPGTYTGTITHSVA